MLNKKPGNDKTKAFTLAEVLITLGIIGIVAAMTIPTLITNTRSQQYRSKFKKAVSTLSQAAKMSMALYDFDYAGISTKCGSDAANENPENTRSICALLNGTLKGSTYYNKVTDIKTNTGKYQANYGPYLGSKSEFDISNFRAYVLNDGTIIAIHRDLSSNCSLGIGAIMKDYPFQQQSATTLDKCLGFIDVNGSSLPNKEVSCSSGSNSLSQQNCIVKNDAEHMTDIYPIRFHDQIVEPASAAARYVLKSAK